MPYRFHPCHSCKSMDFNVRQHTESGELLVVCRACGVVLLRSAPPETMQSQASGGSTHAPVGGAYRP